MNILMNSWQHVTGGDSHCTDFFDLVCRYSNGDRYHHNLEHIRDMIRGLLEYEAEHPSQHSYPDLHRAIWWHDAIYDARRSDNEERSADLAAVTLADWGIGSESISKVRSLILATRGHDGENADTSERLIIFLDLSILATSRTRYRLYAENIRSEYAWVEDGAYVAGRSKFLQSMLAKPKIFPLHPDMEYRELCEMQARRNIHEELEWISAAEPNKTPI